MQEHHLRATVVFLAGVEKELDAFVGLIKGGGLSDRDAVVKRLSSILQAASSRNQEKESNTMFMAHQVVADLDEVSSGEGGFGTSPFEGDYIWAGYGGKQGFLALDHTDVTK